MKKILLASLILVSSLGAANAQANDTLIGAVIGGGVGSVIGHSVGGRDGALVGGLVGAAAGVVIASNDGPRYVNAGYAAPAYYAPPPRPVRYVTPVYYRPAPAPHRGWDRRDRDRHHDDHRRWH